MKQPRYYLVPLPLTPATKPAVALECLIRTTGDTHGVVHIMHAGDFVLWRLGKRVASYPNLNSMYAYLDRLMS